MTDADAEAELDRRVRRMFDEVMNRRRREAIADFIAEDVVDHTPAPEQGPGRAGIAEMVGILLDANPDLRVVVDDVVVQGDRAAVRETWHTVNGVQQIAHFFRFTDDLVVEEWSMGWYDPPKAPADDETSTE